jgi:hypothetical protein
MDKNHIIINYYVDWKSTDWMKELFELNGFNSDGIDWDTMFGGNPKTEVPGRAPALNNKQCGI